jgi:hypothetical protein
MQSSFSFHFPSFFAFYPLILILVLVLWLLAFCALVSCLEYLLQFFECSSDGIFFHVETFLSILFFFLATFVFSKPFFFFLPSNILNLFLLFFHSLIIFFFFFFLDYFQSQKFHLPSLFFSLQSFLLSP